MRLKAVFKFPVKPNASQTVLNVWLEDAIDLQFELERGRIALELEEEKKTQDKREKVLQEQAKKIENLSSMVLYSNRDESRDHLKKVYSAFQPKASAVKSMRTERHIGLFLPFEELVNETEVGDESCKQKDCKINSSEDCNILDLCALLHVKNRRKVPLGKQSSFVVCTMPFAEPVFG
ncbi:hypothetical protein QYF36_021671 [Acer negundo]|nr:hypothetical protein QYF36_021671 [Acer negundo]